jgi:nucleoside-diphosphate-sugar epimerase
VYNVGCGSRISVNDLWHRIVQLAGSSARVRYEPSRPGDVRDSLASLEATRRALGYEPVVTLDEGLSLTVRSFTSVSTPAFSSAAVV